MANKKKTEDVVSEIQVTENVVAKPQITEAEAIRESDMLVMEVEKGRRALAAQFRNEEKVDIKIPPLYKPYFGKIMTISINGISCAIPVDGKVYQVPKSFAEEANIRLFKQDELLRKQEKLTEASMNRNNFENYPGELALF